jgi:hypothetical protein
MAPLIEAVVKRYSIDCNAMEDWVHTPYNLGSELMAGGVPQKVRAVVNLSLR